MLMRMLASLVSLSLSLSLRSSWQPSMSLRRSFRGRTARCAAALALPPTCRRPIPLVGHTNPHPHPRTLLLLLNSNFRGRLPQGKFIAGKECTIADILFTVLLARLHFATELAVRLPPPRAHVRAHVRARSRALSSSRSMLRALPAPAARLRASIAPMRQRRPLTHTSSASHATLQRPRRPDRSPPLHLFSIAAPPHPPRLRRRRSLTGPRLPSTGQW